MDLRHPPHEKPLLQVVCGAGVFVGQHKGDQCRRDSKLPRNAAHGAGFADQSQILDPFWEICAPGGLGFRQSAHRSSLPSGSFERTTFPRLGS